MLYINSYLIIALFIYVILIYGGLKLILDTNINLKKYNITRIKSNINKNLNYNDDNEFEKSGLKISIKKYYKPYQTIRYSIICMLIVFLLYKLFMTKSISIICLTLIIAIYILTGTKVKVLNHWTPFGLVIKELDKDLKKKQDFELSSIIIQLQNIALSHQNNPTTLSHMLMSVVRFAKYTKLGFTKMVLYLDQGDEENAKKAFIEEINTSLGRDLAHILIKLDSINPVEVLNQLKAFEERVKNENITHKNQIEEFYSNMLYMIPTALCFVILLNFLKIILSIIMNFSSFY